MSKKKAVGIVAVYFSKEELLFLPVYRDTTIGDRLHLMKDDLSIKKGIIVGEHRVDEYPNLTAGKTFDEFISEIKDEGLKEWFLNISNIRDELKKVELEKYL